MRAAEPFRLPPITSGWSPRWLAASLVAHVVGLLVWASTNPPRLVREARPTGGALIVLEAPADAPAGPVFWEVQSGPAGGSRVSTAPSIGVPTLAVTGDSAGLLAVWGRGDSAGAPAGGARGVPGARSLARAVPQYGDGRLWVRPYYLPPGGGRPIRMDSVAAVRMLAMADSMERFPPANPNANPYVSRGWTFRRNGKTYGWDAAGIHLGDFTIPNIALALLSMPQGNIDQSRANSALMEMRADIMRAAARAAAEEDFRQAVRDIRIRRDRERALQRARDSARTALTP